MGNTHSDRLEATPWRTLSCKATTIPEMKKEMSTNIKKFQKHEGVKFLNVLLLGQSSSGKSSFINSCATALLDDNRIVTPCAVLQPQSESVTTCLEAHPIRMSRNEILPVRIFDCRGLHNMKGVDSDDLFNMCLGKIKNGYKFDPERPIRKDHEHFRENPALNDKMHCVVYVAAADNPKELLADQGAHEQLKKIRSALSAENVPQLVLLNKIDLLGIRDINTIFRNKMVKGICEGASEFMELPVGHVLPMVNYTTEQVPDALKEFLALYNLWNMMNKANDYVSCRADAPEGFHD